MKEKHCWLVEEIRFIRQANGAGRSHYLSIMVTQIVILTFEDISTKRCTGNHIHSEHSISD